jgi:hypothetical protein
LDLSLLAEHEITRLIHLVVEIGQRLKIDGAGQSEIDQLKRDVQPERVLDKIEAAARDRG